MRKRQRVVLRAKVRQARRASVRNFLARASRAVLLAVLVFYAGRTLKRAAMDPGAFRVRVIQASPSGPMHSAVLKEAAALNGRMIFHLGLGRMEKAMREKYPRLESVRLRRSLPDRVRIEYRLREPVGVLRRGNEVLGVDRGGVLFPLGTDAGDWPQIAASSETLSAALDFLRFWAASGRERAPGICSLPMRKLWLDESGEIVLTLRGEAPQEEGPRVIWGDSRPEWFAEKLERLDQVAADLSAKSMRVEYVNLRGVPQTGATSLSGRQVVGRVVVRPLPAPRALSAPPADPGAKLKA